MRTNPDYGQGLPGGLCPRVFWAFPLGLSSGHAKGKPAHVPSRLADRDGPIETGRSRRAVGGRRPRRPWALGVSSGAPFEIAVPPCPAGGKPVDPRCSYLAFSTSTLIMMPNCSATTTTATTSNWVSMLTRRRRRSSGLEATASGGWTTEVGSSSLVIFYTFFVSCVMASGSRPRRGIARGA